jgi:hypothetical protein
MYLGFVVTVADLVLSVVALDRYNDQVNQAQQARAMTLGVAADAVGVAAWLWLALACRRGAGWSRLAGTALLVIYSACTLIIGLATHDDPGARFATIAVWATGLAAAVLLWSPPAGAFFAKWRRR